MIITRSLKVSCEDSEFYTFFNKEQREQNKALNIAIGYIHTNNILKSVDSGAENRIKKSVDKLQAKIDKLNKDLENPNITEKKKEQTLKAISTNKSLLDGELKILEEGKSFRQGLDKEFSKIYIDHNNLYHLLNKQTQIEYMRTLDMVTQKVKQDYSNNFVDIITGKSSLMNYKSTYPLMIDKKCISIFKEDDEYFIKIMRGYELKIILGYRQNENIDELKTTLDRCITGEYEICQSSIGKKDNKLIFNLSLKIPDKKGHEPVEGRTLGVDLGIKYPAYMCLSDDTYKRGHIGSINDFLRVRQQMQHRRKKLQRDLKFNKGGKGRHKKLQALDRLKDKEKNFVQTYNHTISYRIVKFAKKYNCEYINMEKLTKDGFNNAILRNWSYYQLQQYIEYKAEREGIKVRYVDPAYTSQTCARCGHIDKENRQTQEKFKCTVCGFELNADHNAAINIARSDKYIK